jgi:hypothetical protein
MINYKKISFLLLLAAMIGGLVGGGIGNIRELRGIALNKLSPKMKHIEHEEQNYKDYYVKKEQKNLQGLHSQMVQKTFTMEPRSAGISKDSIRIIFKSKAKIYGILISGDVWGSTGLVEFAANINGKTGYDIEKGSDFLIHTSDTRPNIYTSGKIDEHIWFGENGFIVNPGDHISIGSWLGNVSNQVADVSPEIIIYYKFVDD